MPAKKPAAKKAPARKAVAKRAPPAVRVPKRPTPAERIPRVVTHPSLDDHLEIIARAVFQAGLSWAFIDARWETYRDAFEGFVCRRVAGYGAPEIERVLETDGVMKSRVKVEGVVRNARALEQIEREFGSVRAYQDSFASYDEARKDARKRFAYMGDLNVYYWRFRTGTDVPPLEEWMRGQERDHPRMREMVAAARHG